MNLIDTLSQKGINGPEAWKGLCGLGVSWLEGNYKVTYADGEHVKSWVVRDSKVTSEPGKGYYYFWVMQNGKKRYVQTPIGRTYIEEIE